MWPVALFAYLLGSVSFAILACRFAGDGDPRAAGSGNAGASNVLRLSGRRWALFALCLDMAKGALPVSLCLHWGADVVAGLWVGLAAVLGHIYPLYFQFRGGKGVSTAAGVLCVLYPALGLTALLVWALIFVISRISSLASVVTVTAVVIKWLWVLPTAWLPALLLWMLIMVRHWSNLQALYQGRERRFRLR